MTPTTPPSERAALITGANRGMGLAYVRHYLEHDWRVIATARDPSEASPLLALREQHEEQLTLTGLDATCEQSIAELAELLSGLDHQLDLVMNNAGVSQPEAFRDWTAANFSKHILANAIGPALIAQAVTPCMKSRSTLVNASSGMGSLGLNIDPAGPLAAYATSKAALNMLTQRLAAMLQPQGITVVAINPGWVKTEMGGEAAPTTIQDAIAKITATIEALTPEQSGRFLEADGTPAPF